MRCHKLRLKEELTLKRENIGGKREGVSLQLHWTCKADYRGAPLKADNNLHHSLLQFFTGVKGCGSRTERVVFRVPRLRERF